MSDNENTRSFMNSATRLSLTAQFKDRFDTATTFGATLFLFAAAFFRSNHVLIEEVVIAGAVGFGLFCLAAGFLRIADYWERVTHTS